MKLLIDLEALRAVDPAAIDCSYIDHPDNRGVIDLIEKATFFLICRHCELGTCVQACPQEALEKEENEVVRRYVLRCSNCYSCAAACPFGTIIPEYIPYKTPVCDYCLGRLGEDEVPLCSRRAPKGAILFGDFEENEEEGIYQVNDHLLVKAIAWKTGET
ncbi:MAG: 4Fe-4S dicluster domain-containing protein [PVC group bacterium]